MDNDLDHGPAQRDLLRGRGGALYREIVEHGSLSARAQRFRVGGEDHDALSLLLDLGLITHERDNLLPVDPTLVQSRVVGPLGVQAADLMTESSEWANAFAELAQVFRRTNSVGGPITEIAGLANINRFLQAVVADADSELLTAQPAGARSAATLKVALARDVRALENGVSMRTLYQHSARRSAPTNQYVAAVTELGAQVRTLDEFFNRLIVVDRRLAIVPGASGTKVAIAIHDPGLVAYLTDIFERYWERATEFTDRGHTTRRAIAEDVFNMTTRMLLEGHSDNASAKRMGVSTRTYASYVAALKDEFGVETRFQLGHAMARAQTHGAANKPADDSAGERPGVGGEPEA
jgi:hypothetical protein